MGHSPGTAAEGPGPNLVGPDPAGSDSADSGFARADLIPAKGAAWAGTALDRYPGAAVIAGPNGMALDANAAGEPIARMLRAGQAEDLRQAISSAQQGRPAQINPLLLPAEPSATPGTPPGTPDAPGTVALAYDAAILPWGDGATVLILARDITLERSLRAALIESRQRYKDLVEAASDFAWETDGAGRFTFVSTHGALGYGAAELVGTLAQDLDDTAVHGADSPFSARSPVREAETWVRDRDGEAACLLTTALPLFNADGEWCGARGLCRDITAERQGEARLAEDRHHERLLTYILGILRDEMDPARVLSAACGALVPALPTTGAAIYRLDRDGVPVCAAQAGNLPGDAQLAALTGRVTQGESQLTIAAPEGTLFGLATQFEAHCNGVLCLWRGASAAPWNREDLILLAEVAAQIGLTNRQLARQEELEALSSTDALTGLHNRRSFMAELERRHSRRAAWRGGAALFFIDLDNFKAVNDRHGHQQGDLVLVSIARILREHTRSRDLVARLGGDEFALFVEDLGLSAAGHKAGEIRDAAAELRDLSGDPAHPLGCSVGVAYCRPEGGEGVGDIVERADQAMYEVKRRGKGGVEVSDLKSKGARR